MPPPRPEEDGPVLPPRRGPEVFGPLLPARREPEIFGPVLPARRGPEVFGPVLPPGPPPAPEVAGPPAPTTPEPPPAPPEPDAACGPLLASGKVVARPAPAVAEGGGCGIAAPVRLEAVVLAGGRHVAVSPPALMRCDLAGQLADWLRDDVAPATAAEGDLVAVDDAAAYTCRNRNWKAGNRISEHARGNAIDLLAFRFAGRVVGLKDTVAGSLMATLRTTACARFATVLGPGSDAYHETDLHLDLEHRRNGFKLCQWTVP